MFKNQAIILSATSGLILLFSQSVMANHHSSYRIAENANGDTLISQKSIEKVVKDKFQDPIISTVLKSNINGPYYVVNTISKYGTIRSTRINAITGYILD